MANETKLCKHCKTEIPKGAKVCPNCRKKQGGIVKWIVLVVVVLIIIAAATSGNSGKDTTTVETDKGTQTSTVQTDENTASDTKEAETEEQEQLEYMSCTVNQMMEDLSANAMKASSTYKDQNLEITGRLATIDSDGKYISLLPDDEFAFVGVTCYIKGDEQKEAVMNMNIGDTITLQGKCTDVGEVLGYYFNIDSIPQ